MELLILFGIVGVPLITAGCIATYLARKEDRNNQSNATGVKPVIV